MSHDVCTKNNTPFTEQFSMASPKCERRLGHTSQTTVTDGSSTVDISAKHPGCEITKTRSGCTVHRPFRLSIDT